jgi:hypothetical protein
MEMVEAGKLPVEIEQMPTGTLIVKKKNNSWFSCPLCQVSSGSKGFTVSKAITKRFWFNGPGRSS